MFAHWFRRFAAHFKDKGFFYALYRGWKYLLYITRLPAPQKKMRFSNSISCGRFRVALVPSGLKLYWGERELTSNVGLNVGLCTLGAWTDSSYGSWEVLKKEPALLVVKNRLRYLPATLLWRLEIAGERKLLWEVRFLAEEDLKIDHKKVLVLLDSKYRMWLTSQAKGLFLSDEQEAPAPAPSLAEPWLGVYPGEKKEAYPGIILRLASRVLNLHALTERLTRPDGWAHLLGIDFSGDHFDKDTGYYLPGEYELFSAELDLLDYSRFMPFIRSLRAGAQTENTSLPRTGRPRVLLLNLPWEKDGRWGVRAGSRWPHLKDDAEEGNYLPFPFFMAYAASLLKKHDFPAQLIDALAEKIPADKIIQEINKSTPDLLVVETSTPSLNYDLALLEKIGNHNFHIALCGPDANIRNPDFLQQHKFIDYVLAGEYEHTLLELAESLWLGRSLKEVKGLIFRDQTGAVVNPSRPLIDLDTLPWPLREGLPMEKYLDTPGGIPLPSAQILASRGCVFKCNFCLWPQVMYGGNNYRTRDINDVVNEMEYLVEKAGFKSVYFDDDTFNIGKPRMLAFCRLLKERGLDKVPWAMMARADLMDEEVLLAMKDAGLAAVKYGVESASQKLVNNCGKNLDLAKAKQMILLTKELGIKVHLTFTFGLPGETKRSIDQTIAFCLALEPDTVQFSITTPFPGTAYFSQMEKKGLLVSRDWDDYDGNFKSVMRLENLSRQDLEDARRKACAAWEEAQTNGLTLNDYWQKFSAACQRRGLLYSLKKAAGFLKKGRIKELLHKVKSNNLDILGVFNGRLAFKGPSTLQIDLTDYCNNNCLACWCNSPLLSPERRNKPKDMLPALLVKKLISDAHGIGLREIYFSGGGEPFMHPDILQILEHAKGLGIACGVNTNFTLLNEQTVDKLVALGLDHLTVSIWAGSAEIYKALHPNKSEEDFYRIREMLTRLNSLKERAPDIKIYNVICNLNYRQIREMLEFARSTKCEFVEFTVVDTMPGATDKLILSPEEGRCVLEQFKELRGEYIDPSNGLRPKILNLETFLRRVANLDAQTAQYDSNFIDNMPCYIGWLFARIMPNGDVNSCLKSHRFPVGNIHRQSFQEIWNSSAQIYFRQKTLKLRKDDSFFSLIGNDPDCQTGCYKSCDDIGRNMLMHQRINQLLPHQRRILKFLGKSRLFK